MKKIIKRSGEEVSFDKNKIASAILKANRSVETSEKADEKLARHIACEIENDVIGVPTVESVQDSVVRALMENGKYVLAQRYIEYRYEHSLRRKNNTTDAKILAIINGNNETAKVENANKDPGILSTQRDYIAGEVNRDLAKRILFPEDIQIAHDRGLIHVHDLDYSMQHYTNCCLVNLADMLQNGTVISGTKICKPHSFSTACNIATQIIAQVASSQYGGQTITLTHLAPFVEISRQKIRQEVICDLAVIGNVIDENALCRVVERRLQREIRAGIQTIQYQLLTLMTTNGQTPFVSVAMYLNEAGEDRQLREDLAMVIAEMLRQRIKGIQNEDGAWVTPAFPKLLYFLEDDNTEKDSPYFWLTELAAECTAKRMVPDYVSEKKMLEYKGNAYPPMGCRSFLTPDRFTEAGFGNMANEKNYTGKRKYYGRFNQGVVTINLPFVALNSHKDFDKFWEEFDETLELCHKALRIRHEHLRGTKSDVAPILWQFGALARLGKGETIDRLLYGGYSTISLGYGGLYETVKYMTGYSHTDEIGEKFALEVMQHMNDKCASWKAAENIDYSLYGTPLENTVYKFAKALQNEFGEIEDVTDHEYITNSYHVNVREKIDAFAKLGFEAKFQKLSPGGAISYVEIPNMSNNIDAVISIIQFIADNCVYAELNSKSDYCQICGYDGEIKIVEESGKLIWECPCCGNRDQHKMNVARRTCGYIGTQFWTQGRTWEIKDRELHVSIDLLSEKEK